MQSYLFESELERVARTLTDQFGVKVQCQGDEAWTNGKQIVLPSLPEPMDQALERMVVGYLDHEMGHVAFSDFKVVEEFAREHPDHEGLLNVIEDALIERRAMERWPGVRVNLDAMFRQIRGRVATMAAERDAFGRFCTAVYLKLAHYHDMLGLDAEVQGYGDLLDEFPSVCDTRDSARLAGKLLERWEQRNPPNMSAQPPTGASGTEDGADGNASAGSQAEESNDQCPSNRQRPSECTEDHGDGDESEEGDDAGDAEDSQTGGNAPDGSAPQTGNGDSATDPTALPTPSDSHGQSDSDEQSEGSVHSSCGRGGRFGGSIVTEALATAIAESVRGLDQSDEYRVYTKEFDHIEPVPVATESDVKELLKKHPDVVRRLRRGLANALRSAEKRWWRHDQIRGELSPRTLHRLCFDRPQLDVFRTQAYVRGRSTAVSIVLDASGSMTTQKMNVARDALLVLLQALGDLKVATEAFTFTTGNGSNVLTAAQQRGEDPNELRFRYSRVSNLEIGLVKQFGEPVRNALRRLPSIHGTGLTPLGEAMQIGACRLFPRPETRQVMLVITDGRAGCESRDDSAVRHAQYVSKRIAAAGIELIGVGIMDESLRAIVADTIVVHALEDLPAQLCKLLGRTLKKGMRHVG